MIKYKDLSGWLKAAAVVSWITGVLYVFSFLVGFFEGLLY
jgi:hypothetical protein